MVGITGCIRMPTTRSTSKHTWTIVFARALVSDFFTRCHGSCAVMYWLVCVRVRVWVGVHMRACMKEMIPPYSCATYLRHHLTDFREAANEIRLIKVWLDFDLHCQRIVLKITRLPDKEAALSSIAWSASVNVTGNDVVSASCSALLRHRDSKFPI